MTDPVDADKKAAQQAPAPHPDGGGNGAIGATWGILVLAILAGTVFHVAGPLHPVVSNGLVVIVVLALVGELALVGWSVSSRSGSAQAPLQFHGTVVDQANTPVANAIVSVVGSAETSPTTAEGRFGLTVDRGVVGRDSIVLIVRRETRAEKFQLRSDGSPFLVVVSKTTTDGDPSSGPKGPLTVRVLAPGSYIPADPLYSYYIVPPDSIRGRDSLSVALQNKMAEIAEFPWDTWAAAHGGVCGSPQHVRIEVRSTSTEPVVIHGIRINVVRRSPPLRGVFATSAECGLLPVRIAHVNLDTVPPIVRYTTGADTRSRFRQSQLTLSVTKSDVEVIEFHARTRRSDIERTAELMHSSAAASGTVLVDDNGKPFRVSSEIGSVAYRLNGMRLERDPDWDDGISVC